MQVTQEGLTKAQSQLVKAAVLCASRRTLKEYLRHLRLDKTIAVQTLGTIKKRIGRCDWSMQPECIHKPATGAYHLTITQSHTLLLLDVNKWTVRLLLSALAES